MTNWYAVATMATSAERRQEALAMFLEQEMHNTHDRLLDIEDIDGSVPDGMEEKWSYEKGKLDNLRLLYGMVQQARAVDTLTSKAAEATEEER